MTGIDASSSVLVLSYHGVCEGAPHPALQPFHCTAEAFDQQARWLAKNYDLLSPDEAALVLKSQSRKRGKFALITVDDGLVSAKTLIAPILKSLSISFSLFVTTRFVGQSWLPVFIGRLALWYTRQPQFKGYRLMDERDRMRAINELIPKVKKGTPTARENWNREFIALLPEEKWLELAKEYYLDTLLDWNEVSELHANGVEIGSHGSRHLLLSEHLQLTDIATELSESRKSLIAKFGRCRAIAYPGGGPGDVSAEASQLAALEGFEFGYTTRFGAFKQGVNLLEIPRVCPPIDYKRFLIWMKHEPWWLLNGYRRFRAHLEERNL